LRIRQGKIEIVSLYSMIELDYIKVKKEIVYTAFDH
jgi:hypothetical protein